MIKFPAVLAAVMLVCSLLSFAAAGEAEKISDGDFEFSPNASGDGMILVRYGGSEPSVSVPAESEGLPVTEIGDNAFYYNPMLQEVILPDTVTVLGQNAFIMCSALQRVQIPDSVLSVGVACFLNCTALTEVRMSRNLTSLGDFAFLSCTALEEITFGPALQSVGQGAFRLCTSLKRITLPPLNSLTLGEDAFLDCPEDLEFHEAEPESSGAEEAAGESEGV